MLDGNKIISVKLLGDSAYLVNGNITVPKENVLSSSIEEWLKKGNKPESEFTNEELNKQRIASIKQKVGQIINSTYNIYWQLNHPRLDANYTNQYEWIDNIRAIGNKAELEGTAL